MSRTVIFKLYKFDGHIYINMTKNELKRLIVECMNKVVIEEGAISMQEVTETIVWSIKEIIKGFSGTIRNLNYKKPLSKEQVLIIVDKINEVIKMTLVDTKISPCLIEFSKDDSDDKGNYHLVLKNITLNSYEYLAKKTFGGYELIEYKDIKFDKMIYTGPIDYFFDYKYGKLPYRSMRFEFRNLKQKNYQETAQVNYVDDSVEFTRVIEHKLLKTYMAVGQLISIFLGAFIFLHISGN